jgi:phosphoglycolate phosphatase-like HAD superfamily hydrolase
MKKAAIIDLDGTLCNADHRLHHVQKKPKDWDAFFAHMHLDTVNEWCRDIVKGCVAVGVNPIFLTGRNEDYRAITAQWLEENLGYGSNWIEARLIMRPTGDRRTDTEFKLEVLRKRIQPFYKVMFAIDDRGGVVNMWREAGIPALQCADWEEKNPAVAQEIHQHFLNKIDEAKAPQ